MGQRAKYENKNPLYRFAVNRFLAHVKKAADSVPVKNILDAACAEGFVLRYLQDRRPELSFKGFDIDCEAIEEAKKINPGVHFECKDLYTLKPGEKLDLVMALEVLEHLTDYEKALQTLRALDSRYFLFSVPREPFFRGLNFLRGRYWKRWGNIPEHVNTWTKGKFKKIIGKYFNIVGDYSSLPWTILLLAKK